MSAEFSRKRILDRIWARMAEPHTAGLALLALACAEALRHWQSSDEATMLTRLCAVIALAAGFISTLELLRPHPRHVAELSARQFVHAWWFPFFDHEHDGKIVAKGWRWRTSVGVYALCVFSIALSSLISSVQYQPSGELMLFPGQEGQEAYRELYPEKDLRRSLGLKLQLQQADVQNGIPYARIRATDMETMAGTDVTLQQAQSVRVREKVYALQELRPIDGIGGVSLHVQNATLDEEISLYPGGEETLKDGSVLRWEDLTSNRFGTLGPALELHHERDGKILDRRWVYLDFPELNAQRSTEGVSLSITEVKRPLAAMLSVQTVGGPAWGLLALGVAILFALLFVAQRFLPAQRIGRSGDYLMLAPADGRALIVDSLGEGENISGEWVTPVREEDIV